MRRLIPILSVAVLILLNDCRFINSPEDEIIQEFIFEFNHINWAWGYQNAGYYITRQGDVYSYNYNNNDKPWAPANWDTLTEDELREKYSHNNALNTSVEEDDVVKMFRLIEGAAHGSYSDTTKVGADGGSYVFIAYQYLAQDKLYIRIILEVTGDWNYRNLSAEAIEIVSWLKGE